MVGPEEEDLPIELHEPLERRVLSEGVVPGLRREQMVRMLPPRDEPRHVRIDPGSGVGPEELDQNPVIPRRTGGGRVERGQLVAKLDLLSG